GICPMRKPLATLATYWLAAVASPQSLAQGDAQARAGAEFKALFRYEPTGLSLLHPHVSGKIPVVFVHGLWASPWSWQRMIDALEAAPAIKDRFQLWAFGSSTGDPIPSPAFLLRRNLNGVRQKLDPARSDPAFDRMVLIGHSMGGFL